LTQVVIRIEIASDPVNALTVDVEDQPLNNRNRKQEDENHEETKNSKFVEDGGSRIGDSLTSDDAIFNLLRVLCILVVFIF